MLIQELIDKSYQTAYEKGWWEGEDHNVPEKLALIHSEVSEALEDWRNNKDMKKIYYTKDGKPEGFIVELADVLIRIGDLCGRYGLNLEEALKVKMEYNDTRPYRHGGKRA